MKEKNLLRVLRDALNISDIKCEGRGIKSGAGVTFSNHDITLTWKMSLVQVEDMNDSSRKSLTVCG